eukprot:103265-Alexandrium_andersonii.AAC.1
MGLSAPSAALLAGSQCLAAVAPSGSSLRWGRLRPLFVAALRLGSARPMLMLPPASSLLCAGHL